MNDQAKAKGLRSGAICKWAAMKGDRIARPLDVQRGRAFDDRNHQQTGRRKRHAVESRLRLIRSTLQLIAERGYPDVTVEAITEAADVGKGTFYNYFESKEHLLAAIAQIQEGAADRAMDEARNGKRTIRLVLNRLARRMCEELERSPNLAHAFLSSMVTGTVIPQEMRKYMSEECHTIAEIIKIGQKRGEISSSQDREQLALLFQQSILGTILLWSLQGEPGLQESVAASIQYFWRVVVAHGKLSEQGSD